MNLFAVKDVFFRMPETHTLNVFLKQKSPAISPTKRIRRTERLKTILFSTEHPLKT